MGRAAPALSSPRLAELRRARRAPRLPPAALLAVDARRRGGAARLAAERRRASTATRPSTRARRRRSRLIPGWTSSSQSSARTRCSSRPCSRSAFGFTSPRGSSASPPPRWASRPSTWSTSWAAPLRAQGGPPGGAADGADALPRGGLAPGAAGWADDVLRDAHAGPLRALPDDRRRGWLYAAGAAMGLTFLSKETSIVLLGRAVRVPGAHTGARCAAARPGRWRWG